MEEKEINPGDAYNIEKKVKLESTIMSILIQHKEAWTHTEKKQS